MLAGAIAAPVVVNRTIFLAPNCGWITPSARMIIPRRIVAESYGEALASGDFTYDSVTQMMSIWNRPRRNAQRSWKYERSETDKKITEAGGSWRDTSEAALYMDQHGIEHDLPAKVYIANVVGRINKPAEIDRSPRPTFFYADDKIGPLLNDPEFAQASAESKKLAALRAAAIRARFA